MHSRQWSKLFIIFLIVFSFLNACAPDKKSEPIIELTKRLMGNRYNEFQFKLIDQKNEKEHAEVNYNNGKVIIEGSSNISLAYGLYSYLKKIGAGMVNWEGTRIDLPKHLPSNISINIKTHFKYRSYLNVCAFGYTTPWWNWERWEQEIDWMALHGINMPTAMEGQESVLLKLWTEFGLSEEDLSNHFTGPAFLPWQRMGNINSHEGPLPLSWMRKKEKLQKQILKRMHSLGMKPVVPAFNGYVPKYFLKKYPNAKIHAMESWGGGIEGTYWLDPIDPLFSKIAARFIELYTKTYGNENYYLVDIFNEMLPPVSDENKFVELKKYGSSIYESMIKANPDAKWVMQGWLFGDKKEFWTPEAVESFLNGIPNDKMVIQDFGNDRREVWKDAKAFYGKEWIYGYVHNYGGTNPVFGDFDFYNDQFKSLLNNPNKQNLVGYGVMPEGLNNNSIIYEYLFDLAWSKNGIEPNEWLENYTHTRYGENIPSIVEAFRLLNESVYSTKYWTTRWWEGAGTYLFNKRPTLKISEFGGHPSNIEKLKTAIELLLDNSTQLKDNEFYKYDLIELSKHYLSIKLDSLLIECVKNYSSNNILKGDKVFEKIKHLSNNIDSLLAAQPLNTLDYWLSSAWDYGETESESQLYLINAKMQIAVWGGNHLKDYASKSWHKMYVKFYWPRWSKFLESYRESKLKNIQFDEISAREKIKNWENEWVLKTEMFPIDTIDNSLDITRLLLEKY